MKRISAIIALAACLLTGQVWGKEYVNSSTQNKLQDVGFSDSFISKLKRNNDATFRKTTASPGVWAQNDTSTPSAGSAEGSGSNVEGIPDGSGSGGSNSGQGALPSPSEKLSDGGSGSGLPPLPAPTKMSNGKKASEAKSSGSSKAPAKSKKKKKKAASKYSSAPVIQSLPEPPMLYDAGTLPSPGAMPSGRDQEIYSQEPVSLPPVSQLPTPSRMTLPPVTRDALQEVPLGEAVSRVLACNFIGLTGLVHTTIADVSKEGSFKMGFHTNWFNLERVYDRVLATGESGRFFESHLFFNYAATSDLEFAMQLPIIDYTIKSRILWPRDFRESGIGDTKLSFKYRVFDNPQYQMRGAFGLGFKFPTGSSDKGLGTGKTDFEVFTAFSKNFEKIIAHLNLGYIMTGDPNTQFYPSGLADIFYYNVGLEYPHTHNVTVTAELNGKDWGAEGLSLDVTPGIRYTPTENFAFEVGVPISVTNDQRFGYNYRMTFGVTSFFQ